MKIIRNSGLVALACMMIIAGCGAPDNTPGKISAKPGQPVVTRSTNLSQSYQNCPTVVKKSIQRIGGMNAWRPVRRLEGKVIISDYAGPANPYVNNFDFRLLLNENLTGRAIVANGSTAGRPVNIEVAPVGEEQFKITASSPQLKSLRKHFALLMNQIQGPVNLAIYNAKSGTTTRRRIHGKVYIRVPAGDGTGGAYYFEPKTNLLKFVTHGTDQAGKPGLVSIYEYCGCGKIIPTKITVIKIGKEVLLGTEKVFEAHFTEIKRFKTHY